MLIADPNIKMSYLDFLSLSVLEKRYNATLRIGSANEDLSKYLVADLGGTICDAILDCIY